MTKETLSTERKTEGKMLVRDLMNRGVITCEADTPLCDVARTMIDENVHSIVVIDEVGEACGVISDLGILKGYNKDFVKMEAEDVLEGCTITVNPSETIEDAVSEMLAKHVHHLVIMSEKPLRRPVGILAATDIVREMANVCIEKRE